jgi:hypothetical protein
MEVGTLASGSTARITGSASAMTSSGVMNSVGIVPGHSAVTATPYGRSSVCSASVKKYTAALDAA